MSMAINFFLQNYANTSAVLLNYDKLKLELTKLLAIVWFVWKSWRAWLTLALMIQLKKISLFSIYIFWWRKKKISKRIIAKYICVWSYKRIKTLPHIFFTIRFILAHPRIEMSIQLLWYLMHSCLHICNILGCAKISNGSSCLLTCFSTIHV